MKLTFFFYFWRIYDRNISLDANLYFFWLNERRFNNRRGCLKHFEHFSFFIFIKFHWQIICYLQKEGRGHCFSKHLFFGINMRIKSTYEYGGTSPPPPPRLRYYVLFSRMNKDKYIYTMYVNFSLVDAFIHRNVCPTSRKPGRRSVTCRLQHSVSDTDTCTWLIHLWTCQLCIWVTV